MIKAFFYHGNSEGCMLARTLEVGYISGSTNRLSSTIPIEMGYNGVSLEFIWKVTFLALA